MVEASLLDNELDELYKVVAEGQERGRKVGRWRRFTAYFLKIVAAGGSLVVATGLFEHWHQMLGIAVLLAVFMDTISSNHKRLIAEVEAGYAYGALRSRVKGDYNRDADPLLKRIKTGDRNAESTLENLKKRAHIDLSSGIEKIRQMLESSDVEALKSLSLDQERGSIANG